jgi:hypothetical protein
MRIVTIGEIEYHPAGGIDRFTIPAGTVCIEADNLPGEGQFWACEWPGMSEAAASYARNYGFLLSGDEVEDRVASVCRVAS